jgi:3-phenylpropionate/trans-cinnamate dioxygenase ferredoxin reductase component
MHHRYIIVGGGVSGASAIEGIRAHDPEGSILLLTRENHAPYRRPLLSRDLWFQTEGLADLSYLSDAYYREKNVTLMLRRDVIELMPETKTIIDDRGASYTYDELLIATGARPRLLDASGADHPELHYFRSLEDYLALEQRISRVQHVLIIGEDFLALELATSIRQRGREVALVVAHDYPLQRMLPRDMGRVLSDHCREAGIELISNAAIVEFMDRGGLLEARTHDGNYITTQTAIVAVGTEPNVELAESAGLEIGNGIEVDEYAHTSAPHVWAAGDVAEFPHLALGRSMRLEQWDHAIHHGRTAGANMAGANRAYAHVPLFAGTVLDVTIEAIGDVDSTWETHAVWREEYREGALFYLHDELIRGVLMWNLVGDPEWARSAIRLSRPTTYEEREAMVLGRAPEPVPVPVKPPPRPR